MSLPTKGTLYQRNLDGSMGAPITNIYQRAKALSAVPTTQYATGVANVSSFWGGSMDWSPYQALGPQDCPAVAADCTKAWCPLTMNGDDGLEQGSGNGLHYSNNPNAMYETFGYTEYIELLYDKPVYPTSVLVGENRGMGAIKNILAKDPYGNWMTLWTASSIDATIENLYYKYNQYRVFIPDICLPPFLTKHLRYEIDTRNVPDWHEYDFFELQGSNVTTDHSMVNFYGNAKWGVYYVPDHAASGVDTFTYSASDCPGSVQRWSSNVGTITVNIVPSGVAGTVIVPRGTTSVVTTIDLSQYSVNTANFTASSSTTKPSVAVLAEATVESVATVAPARALMMSPQAAAIIAQPLTYTITALPTAGGSLYDSGAAITSVPYKLAGKTVDFRATACCTSYDTCSSAQIAQQAAQNSTSFSYTSSDPLQTAPVQVLLNIACPRVPQPPVSVAVISAGAIAAIAVVSSLVSIVVHLSLSLSCGCFLSYHDHSNHCCLRSS